MAPAPSEPEYDRHPLRASSSAAEWRIRYEGRFEALYNEWREVVRDTARLVLDSDADAEDVAERVFLRLWKNGGWWGIEHPLRFFRNAGRNEALNLLRHRQKVPTRTLDQELASWVESPASLPDEIMQVKERREIVERMIHRLPPRCGLVCTLVFLRGLTHREVAERLGISCGAVEKQVARARRRIREMASPFRRTDGMSSRLDGGG